MDHTSTPFVLSYKSLLPSILSTIFPFRSKAKIGLFRLLSNQTNKPVFRLVETFYELDVEIYVLYPFCKTEPLFGFFNFHRNARFLPFITLFRRRLTVWGLFSRVIRRAPFQRYTRLVDQNPLTALKPYMRKAPRTRHGALRWREGRLHCFQIIVRRLFGFLFRRFFFLVGGLFGFLFRRFFLLIRRRFIFNGRFSFRFGFHAS